MSSAKSKLSHMAMAQQTTFYTFLWFAVVLLMFAVCVDCRVCTRMTLTKQHRTETIVAECINSYEARCRWFSREMCTFNETVPCVKKMNKTYDSYRVVEDCCPGYQKNEDGKCINHKEIASHSKGKFNNIKEIATPFKEKGRQKTGRVIDEDDDKFFLGISHGAYAGIVCGILFITCVAFLSAINYRKRRLRQAKMNSMNFEQEVAQKQQMIPIGPLESGDPPSSPTVNT